MMIKLFARIFAMPAILIACMLVISGGCSAPGDEGFAIYLTRDDIPSARMEALSHVDIAQQPLIGLNDIVAYDEATHEITLTKSAYDRVCSLEVPVRGRSFLVCLDRHPVYWGAFWTPISSLSFDGITIWKPLGHGDAEVIKLEPGYPAPSFYTGEDPRDDPELMESLAKAGKLITSPPVAGKLPHAMKGYELYSWQADNQWHFTLITGTNRNKTPEEITANSSSVTDDGWVHIHVVGQDAVNSVLSKLPQNEEIFWFSCLRTGHSAQSDIDITLPPAIIIVVIKSHAEQCGLKLAVVQAE